MQNFKCAFGVSALSLLLAACSQTTGGSPAPTAQGPTASTIASAYVASGAKTYGASGATTSAAALAAPGGNRAFGVGTGLAGRAAGSTPATVKLGNIAIDNTNRTMTLTIDGVPRTLNLAEQVGYSKQYGYMNGQPIGDEVVVVADIPFMENGRPVDGYVSLALHAKGANWQRQGLRDIAITAEEYNILVSGLLTPEARLPTSARASYAATWLVSADGNLENIQTGNGIAKITADFTNKTISGRAAEGHYISDLNNAHTNISGTISGNTFSGTTNRTGSGGLNGEFSGGFFGPNAEQVAGTGTGKVLKGGSDVDATVVFVGNQFPETYFAAAP